MLTLFALLCFVSAVAAVAQFQLFKGSQGKYYFRLRANNHEITLQSEAYNDRTGMITGVNSVRENGVDEAQFSKLTSKDNKPYFVLKAKNGMIIGSSETYNSVAARDNGIASIISVLKQTPTIEQVDLIDDGLSGVFELFTDVTGKPRFRLRAVNGQIILAATQGYACKGDALAAIDLVKQQALSYANFELKDPSKNSQYWFTLKNVADIIGVSEMYKTQGGRANGIYSVQRHVKNSRLVDYTVDLEVATTKPSPQIEIFQSAYGLFAFQVRNSNGSIVFTSYLYGSVIDTKKAITDFKTDAKTVTEDMQKGGLINYLVFTFFGSSLISGYDEATFSADLRKTVSAAIIVDLTAANDVLRRARFELFCGTQASTFYWRLKDSNGVTLISSTAYKSKKLAENGISVVKTYVKNLKVDLVAEDPKTLPKTCESATTTDKKPYYLLVAPVGRYIHAVSDTFESVAARDNAIFSVIRTAPTATINDLATTCTLKDDCKYPAGFNFASANAARMEDPIETEEPISTSSASTLVVSWALVAFVARLF